MSASISRLLLVFCFVGIALQPTTTQAQNADPSEELLGMWSAEGDRFRPVFRFKRGDEGTVTAFLTNDKSQEGSPFSSTTVRGDSILLELAPADARFQGALSEDGSRIEGTWIQGDRSVPITLTPVGETAATGPNRPQHPKPPYPYVSEEVAVRNEADGITLAGTLTRPEGKGPYLGVVLVSGTGRSDRNYEVGGHKPFLVLSDHLTRHGFAVLRYDKRGVAESEGHFMSASFEDFARDAAALRFLKSRPSVAASETGFVTHSSGGLIALQANHRREDAAFLALLMPPSRPGYKVLAGQNSRLAAAAGVSAAKVDSIRASSRRLYDAIRADTDSVTAAARVRSIIKERGVRGEELETRVAGNTTPWLRDFARYDPRPTLRKVDVPALAIFGTEDLFVPPEQNAGLMRSALEESPSSDVAAHVLEGLNHWLQPAETGLPSEISKIETTMAPEVLDVTTDWIRKHISANE